MVLEFVGEHEEFTNVPIGWVSWDYALRYNHQKLGITDRNYVEIYGQEGVGKTTIMTSLGLELAKILDREISCLDIESLNPNLVRNANEHTKYTGRWHWIKHDKVSTKYQHDDESVKHEKLLGDLGKRLGTNGDIVLLDSVAAIIPVSEKEGDVGDANIGRRAFPLAQFSREVGSALGSRGRFALATNHKYEEVATGLAFKTFNTPGGKVKNYFMRTIVDIKVPYLALGGSGKKEMDFGNGRLIEGIVRKNTHGVVGENFWLFAVGGHGVHKGLTAMFDCVKFGLAEFTGGKGVTTVEIALKSSGETLGKVQDVIENRNELDFTPFYSALNEWLVEQGANPVFEIDEQRFEAVIEDETDGLQNAADLLGDEE